MIDPTPLVEALEPLLYAIEELVPYLDNLTDYSSTMLEWKPNRLLKEIPERLATTTEALATFRANSGDDGLESGSISIAAQEAESKIWELYEDNTETERSDNYAMFRQAVAIEIQAAIDKSRPPTPEPSAKVEKCPNPYCYKGKLMMADCDLTICPDCKGTGEVAKVEGEL